MPLNGSRAPIGLGASLRLMAAIFRHDGQTGDRPPPLPTTLAADPAARRTIIWATLALWLANYTLLTARNFLDAHPHAVELAGIRAGLALFGCLLCYGIHRVLDRMGSRPFRHKGLAAAVMAPIAADAYSWVNMFATEPVSLGGAFSVGAAIFNVTFWLWFFFAWTTLYLAVAYSSQVKAQERRSALLQAEAHAAQLRALRYQVNPHFLFNTLNSISTLILDGRNGEAEAMVRKLSAFFRTTLAAEPLDAIRLDDEIALQKAYLEIEQVRFPDLEVEVAVTEAAREALVPTLILQPLVENAVKFAVARSLEPTRIRIGAERRGDELILEVADDGRQGRAPRGTGVGLRNVRARLARIYGTSGRLEAGPTPPRGFRVELGLPFETAP